MRGVNNSVETVNAAATAIISAESRVQQVTDSRRRWGACFSVYWCFGSQRQAKRISHAVLVPERTFTGSDAPPPENQNHPPAVTLPFVAPPSSPASFLQSESTSANQSPARFLSLSALSASAYSPSGPTSIFAIGPYANETQLVSPPVFSTFTTEPSTAPLTPPPEPVQLTTPSSPEVPFARLLSSFNSSRRQSEANEFQTYQLYPGSPIGHIISPSSVCSGTSSPFPDLEFHASGSGSVSTFPVSEPPRILTAEGVAARKLVPLVSRDKTSPLNGQDTAIAPTVTSDIRPQSEDPVMGHRVSFELTAEEVARCMEKKPAFSIEAASGSLWDTAESMSERNQCLDDGGSSKVHHVDCSDHDLPEEVRPAAAALPAVKEFKFNNADGAEAEPGVGPDWWAHEKVVGAETNWAFFPIIQPGVS